MDAVCNESVIGAFCWSVTNCTLSAIHASVPCIDESLTVCTLNAALNYYCIECHCFESNVNLRASTNLSQKAQESTLSSIFQTQCVKCTQFSATGKSENKEGGE